MLTARAISCAPYAASPFTRASRSKLERFVLSHASLAHSLSVANAFRT